MKITAGVVKELREKTGSGMMECKKALTETKGDIEQAIVWMRKNGQTKAEKKGVRATTEGLVNSRVTKNGAVMIEVNCETDFVARGDKFKNFSDGLLDILLNNHELHELDDLLSSHHETGQSVDEWRKSLIATIGENITIRRFHRINIKDNNKLGMYLHGARIGVLVELNGSDNEALIKNIAMHIAASKPEVVKPEDYPSDKLERERDIYKAKLENSGKPEVIQNKILDGQIDKFLRQVALEGQVYIKDPGLTVGELLKENKSDVVSFIRYELGEGLEKKVIDFASEVKEQIKGI